ncbi:MAG: AAA family ATPase [Limisphaerales bacterium]
MTRTLAEWLKANDLAEFEEVFVGNQVDLKTLEILTEPDLKELGLAFGPRKRILGAIAELKNQAVLARAGLATPEPTASLGERRQLTVMFCDLVGSTALSTVLDPEELRELIRTYRKACADVVTRYGGHVAQYLGDGLMIYFGWPKAHEDAAERAVRSALEIVRAVKAIGAERPLAVRLGLATGTVVVGEASRNDAAGAMTALGDAPNLAARLQGLAGPDEVVIGLATRRLVGDAFALTDLGEHLLKGIANPVPVWRVDAVRRMEARFDAAHAGKQLTALVGREEELALLLRRWQRARDGDGQVVLIGGEAGIGKSRLCHVLRERLAEVHTALRYQCSPHYSNSALYPIIEQLEFAANLAREDTPEQRLDKVQALLVGEAAEIAATAPLIAALLSLPTHRYPPLGLSPQRQKERTLEVLGGQVEALARRGPVLMVFEDLHWVDPTSQELLEALVPRLEGLPVLLVATHRLEYAPPWVGRPNVTSLSLRRLERSTVTQFVGEMTGGRGLPPEVLEEILSHTDGVPLFVEELTRSVLESGLLREEGNQYRLQVPLPSLAIPTSLRDSLAARLDRLAPVKEIAQIGACIGREFSRELLSRLAALDGAQLGAALDRLVDAGLITRRGTPPDDIYTFKHALVQDAAYDLLLKSSRCRLHAGIAKALETGFADEVAHKPELLAHHHTQAGSLAAAIPLWRRAGALAIGRVALQEAVAHLQRALGLTDQLPLSTERDALELSIREQLNAAWAGLRGWAAEEIGVNTVAILRLAESQLSAQSKVLGLWWMWTNTITQGRIADSLPWAQRLLDEGQEAEGGELQIFGPAAAMVSRFFLGQLTEARAQADRVLALYDPRRAERWIQLTGHDLRTFVGVYSCQWIWMQGHPDQAVQVSDASTAQARAVGHAFNLAWALTFGAYVFAYRHEPGQLLERVDAADRLAREQGLAFIHQVSVPQAAGLAQLHQGRSLEAIPALRRGIESWTNVGGGVRIPYLKSVLAEAVARQGDLPAALQLIDECLEQIERPAFQERIWLAEVLRLKGWMLMGQGRDEEAGTQLRAALDCARQQGTKSWELRSAVTLAGLLEKHGDLAAARDLLAPLCGWFTEGADTKELIEARTLLERLASAPPRDPAPMRDRSLS